MKRSFDPPSGLPDLAPLSNVDRAWLRMDHPHNLMMINGVMLLDAPLDRDRMRRVIERRLLAVPRFRQRVVVPRTGKGAGRAHWETDPHLDLDHHLSPLRLPPPGDDAVLQAEVSNLLSRPPDFTRPLWYFHPVEGYGEHGALIGRIHHCIGDGLALMMGLLSLTSLQPDDDLVGEDGPLTRLFGTTGLAPEAAMELAGQVLPGAMGLLTKSADVMREAPFWKIGAACAKAFGRLVVLPPDPRGAFRGKLGAAKRVAWSSGLPLEELRNIQATLGGTLNDLLLTAVAGALRRYLAEAGGGRKVRDFRALVPISLRPLEEMVALGNRFGLLFLPLPVAIADPRERLAELQRRMQALKRSAEPLVTFGVLRIIGALPPALQRLAVTIFSAKGTAVMTNVPGPTETLYLAGREVEGFMFWVPQSGSVAMGISILSYRNQMRLGIAVDGRLVPDPQAIIRHLDDEIEVMRALAEPS